MSVLKSTLLLCKCHGCIYLINTGSAGVRIRGKPAKAHGGKLHENRISATDYLEIRLVSAIKHVILTCLGQTVILRH